MRDDEHRFVVGMDLQGNDQFFFCACSASDRKLRKHRIESIWSDNCRAAGVELWSPLGLSFAQEVAGGRFPVSYSPCRHVFESDDPHLEYAEMFNVERYRFPSADLRPSDKELFTRGIAELRDRQTQIVADLERELRMDGVLLESQEVSMSPKKPLVDDDTQTVMYDGKTMTIRGAIQFRLFQRLAEDAGQFVNNLTLAEFVWGDETKTDKDISNTIGHVKKKLKNAGITGISFEPAHGRKRMVLS